MELLKARRSALSYGVMYLMLSSSRKNGGDSIKINTQTDRQDGLFRDTICPTLGSGLRIVGRVAERRHEAEQHFKKNRSKPCIRGSVNIQLEDGVGLPGCLFTISYSEHENCSSLKFSGDESDALHTSPSFVLPLSY